MHETGTCTTFDLVCGENRVSLDQRDMGPPADQPWIPPFESIGTEIVGSTASHCRSRSRSPCCRSRTSRSRSPSPSPSHGLGVELVHLGDLAELAELAELEDEMIVTICQSLCSGPSLALQANPETAQPTYQPASSAPGILAHGGSVPPTMMLAAQQHVPSLSQQSSGLTEEEGSFHSRRSCTTDSSISMTAAQQHGGSAACHAACHSLPQAPADVLRRRFLQEIFTVHVMRDYTPRRPNMLPTSEWVALEELATRLQVQLRQHSSTETTRLDHQYPSPGSLRPLITEWYMGHPAFAGLPFSTWGKKLKDIRPHVHARSLTFKFCFECTPGGLRIHLPLIK